MSAPDDELVQRYREASAQDDARPGAHVRGAVRAHAHMLAAAATANPTPSSQTAAANQSRWKISVLASVAVVGLTGMLMLQFERATLSEKEIAYGTGRPHVPAPTHPSSPVPSAAPAPVAAPPAAQAVSAASPAPDGVQSSARDATNPSAKLGVQKPTATAPDPARQRAQASPAPADLGADSSSRTGTGRAMSGFPASPPQVAGPSAAPPAPSTTRAETRERPEMEGDVPPLPHGSRASRATGGLAEEPLSAGPPPATAPRADATQASASLLHDLWQAASAGNTPWVENLIHQGAPVNARDRSGRTALMLAASSGQASTVEKLLALGANPTLIDRTGLTAAQQAQRLGHGRIAELIESAR